MRALCLLLAACSAGAPTTREPAPAPPTRATAADKLRARVAAVSAEGAWTDIVVEGTDDHAKQFCSRLVAHVASMGPSRGGLHVVHECSVEPLPPVSVGAYRLVDREEVDEHSFALDAVLRGTAPDATPARGVVTNYVPFADRDSCEAMRARLVADTRRDWADLRRAEDTHTEQRLRQARAEETATCSRAQQAATSCTTLQGDARSDCLLDAEPERVECDRAHREREMLEARAARPRVAPIPRDECRARPD